nr:hypothetical protein [uncultured Flavobacterium sp.]
MKKILVLFTVLLSIVSNSQNTKIENYDLGRLFEKLKYMDYTDYKTEYNQYYNYVNIDAAVSFLNEFDKNNNTLIHQLRNTGIGKEYYTYLEKIVENYRKNNGYYDNGSKKRYTYIKNHVTAYEMVSKYYVELYNNDIDRKKLQQESAKKYSQDSLQIISAKILENREKLVQLDLKKTKLALAHEAEASKNKGTNLNGLTAKYTPLYNEIQKEKNLIANYNYASIIPPRNRADETELIKKRDELRKSFENEWVKLFTQVDTKIYTPEVLKNN